jgi:SAM-dependent methyltransferase
MGTLSERAFLDNQYRNASNLSARIELHRRFSTSPYGWQRWVLDQILAVAGQDVLEVGCGSAALWTENRERIPDAWRMLLSDRSPGMLVDAQHRLDRDAGRFRFLCTDAQALPLPDASLDMLVANHMLYHVPDRSRALAEFRRVLRPGGRLFAATNGPQHLRELQRAELAVRFGLSEDLLAGMLTDGSAPIRAFDLENGAGQLGRYFEPVALEVYEDGLIVTEPEPLADYLLSMSTLEGPAADRLRQAVAAGMAGGPLAITKSTGLFVALR